jgi:hypothetical protein
MRDVEGTGDRTMTKQTGRKTLLIAFYAVALSLLLLTLISCQDELEDQCAEYATWEARATRSVATYAAATQEAATAIVEVETYEARATSEAEATAAAQADATRISEEGASTEPALEITEMSTKLLKDDAERGVADIDFIFTVKYATAGHTAFLVCYEENVESDRTPVSAESGASEVIVHLVDFDYYGAGQYDPFCELRDTSSGEVLAEAYPGEATIYGD